MAVRWSRPVLASIIFPSIMVATVLRAQGQAPQTPSTPRPLATTLAHLAAESEAYASAVPSFACTEVIHTRLLRKGKEKQHADYETAIRVLRQPDGTLDETFVITLFNGQPPVIGKPLQTIAYLDGGLSKGLPSFFSARQRNCYRYTQDGGRIDFTTEQREGAVCKDAPSTVGFGLLDDDGNLQHGEVRRSPDDARKRRNPMLVTIDYAAVRLGDQTYRMPSHLYAETSPDTATQTTFEAHYTGCHLFKVTATILPSPQTAEGPP